MNEPQDQHASASNYVDRWDAVNLNLLANTTIMRSKADTVKMRLNVGKA